MSFHVSDSEWVIDSSEPAVASRRLPIRLTRLGDERLAHLVMTGRQRAFAVLYERYHQQLYRYCRSMLRNDVDAQDALQSTFALALAALQEGKRNAPFRPWLFRIAHNESISLIRRRRDAGEVSESMLAPVASASEEAADRERLTMLMGDLAQLPERQRAALVMRELGGLSHADIAVALSTTVTAAKQAIFDARSALLEFAEGRALACDEVRRTISERDGRVLRGRRMRSHLRGCSSCAAFAAGIRERRSDLQALAPALPPAASAALLARLGASGLPHGGGGGVATAGGLSNLGGAALASKAAVGATVAVTAAAGLGVLPNVVPLPAPGAASGAHAAPSTARAGARSNSAAAPAPLGPAALSQLGSRSGSRNVVVLRPPEHRAVPLAGPLRSGAATSRGGSSTGAGSGAAAGAAASAKSAPGKSGLAHGHSGGARGKSGVAHGHSSQAPGQAVKAGHAKKAGQAAKPGHAPPGRTAGTGKSAAPGHKKSSAETGDFTAPAGSVEGSSTPAKLNHKLKAAASDTASDPVIASPSPASHAK